MHLSPKHVLHLFLASKSSSEPLLSRKCNLSPSCATRALMYCSTPNSLAIYPIPVQNALLNYFPKPISRLPSSVLIPFPQVVDLLPQQRLTFTPPTNPSAFFHFLCYHLIASLTSFQIKLSSLPPLLKGFCNLNLSYCYLWHRPQISIPHTPHLPRQICSNSSFSHASAWWGFDLILSPQLLKLWKVTIR